jgi:hypothetical protein
VRRNRAPRAIVVGGIAAIAAGLAIPHVSTAASGLPDNRGYELVSPPAKNGADVLLMSSKTHAATDGNAVSFSALNAFGPANGTSSDVQYLSRRDGKTTNGWSARAINPPGGPVTLDALTYGNLPSFEAAFTPDLSAAVYRSWRPLTDAPNVADVSNLYRISDLDGSSQQYQLLSGSAVPLVILPPPFDVFALFVRSALNGTSRDLSHVVFQSPWNLTGDGSFSFTGNLYEYAEGAGVRLVGRVPSSPDTECDDATSTPCVDAGSSQAGVPVSSGFAQYSAGMVSDDGSRILFQVPAGGTDGAIYMREDGVRTFQLNASEKTTPDSPGTAQAWGMTPDGSHVFFTTTEALIDGQPGGLYMWDRSAPAGSRLTLLSGDGSGGGLEVTGYVGASSDGGYVYFMGNGQIVPGEPSGVLDGLFLWHDGAVAYIGRFSVPGEVAINTPRAVWNSQRFARAARVSSDGRSLLFGVESDAGFRGRGGFVGYDHGSGCTFTASGSCRELYLYRADTGGLVCVSCNLRSPVARGDALTDTLAAVSASLPTQHQPQALTDDGRRVFFNTPEALVPEDSNERWDAYEYDVPSRTVHLLSTGKEPSDSYFLEATANGDDVFIVTRQRLVGWDVDDNYDLYDVRVNGGFPEPVTPAPQCAGETCRPPTTAPPAMSDTASKDFRGAGNAHAHLRKPRRCKGRLVLRRVRGKRRCVRRRVHRHVKRSRVRHERSGQ